jgi:L-lactate dehydrogenase complex protein LldG
MSQAREEVLSAVRAALKSARLPDVPPGHPPPDLPPSGADEQRFVSELKTLPAKVYRASGPSDAAEMATRLLREAGAGRALAWQLNEIGCPGLEAALTDARITLVQRGEPRDLADVPVGMTGAEAGLADTGTLVLRSGPGRSPMVSLLPPVHVVLLARERILPGMAEYLASLDDPAEHVREVGNLVFLSGPSHTGDIEQTLTLGVHGPRELHVILW